MPDRSAAPSPARTEPRHARGERPTLRHIPALDGLRGLAVAGVLLFHAGHLTGGFLGVDLFFVLSGFLITSLLLLEREGTGRVDLAAFWGRRFRRLLPALLVVLVAVVAYGAIEMSPAGLADLRRDALGTLFYVANWVAIDAGSDYWAAYAEPSPLEHTWSLAIEEQFYVLWPLVVAGTLLVARGRRWALGAVTGGLIVASVTALVLAYEPGGGTNRAYYGTDTRLAAILYGAVAALLLAGRRRAPSEPAERALAGAALPALAVLAVAWVTAAGTDPWLYRWGFPLLGVSAAVLIAAVTGPRALGLRRVLETAPLTHLGTISYGLYLWHWPVYVVLDEDRTGLDGWALTAVRLAVSLGVAELSLRLVERPVRQGRLGRRAAPAMALAFAVTAGVVVVGTGEGERRVDQQAIDELGSLLEPKTGKPRVLLVGDSGAALLAEGMQVAADELGVELVPGGTIGCGIARAGDGVSTPDGSFIADPPDCDAWPERWGQLLTETDPDAAILFLAWGGIGDRQVEGAARHPCDPTFDAYYRSEVDAALEVLGDIPVYVATTPYVATARDFDDRVDCLNAVYRAAAEDHPAARLLDLAEWTCPAGECREEHDGTVLRPDGVHFEGDGGIHAGRWLLDRVLETLELDPSRLPLRVLLVGDSQASVLGKSFIVADQYGASVRSVTKIGCGTTAGTPRNGPRRFPVDCEPERARWIGTADDIEARTVVFLGGAWEVLDHEIDGELVAFGSPEWDEAVESGLEHWLAPLADRQLFVMTAPCFHPTSDDPDAAPVRGEPGRVERYNEILRTVAARLDATVIEYGERICGTPDGETLRYDGVHLTDEGALVIWRWLIPQLTGQPAPIDAG